jgi:hypothetical protein
MTATAPGRKRALAILLVCEVAARGGKGLARGAPGRKYLGDPRNVL